MNFIKIINQFDINITFLNLYFFFVFGLFISITWPKYNINKKTLLKIFFSFHLFILLFILLIFKQYFHENILNFLQYNLNYNLFILDKLIIQFSINIDILSLFFILLIIFIFTLCFLYSWTTTKQKKKYFYFLFILLEIILIFIFSVSDIFLFYCFFELSLIPMILIIGLWGNRSRKIKAIFYFFLFTLFGSILLLIGILYIINTKNTSDYYLLLLENFTEKEQKFLWLLFFFGFAVKIPIIPFHIRLPEAHVEAPTIGSVILAAILLKLGGYGLLKFCIPLFPYANIYYNPLIFTICTISIIYSSLTAIRQNDLKRIIAYSSISHMNYVVLGIFSLTFDGILGSIILMFGHAIVSSALFFLVGILYDRYHTKLIKYYSGILQIMPIFSFLFFFL